MMRQNIYRPGDIFEIQLDDGRKRYFQFVCRDLEDLNSDVIRVFKRCYVADSQPSAEIIISDDVEQYLHTSVYAGVKFGFWTRYAVSQDVGSLDIYFRDSDDAGFHHNDPKVQKISIRWFVWKINEPRVFYGTLPERFYSAHIGGVYPPFFVAQKIKENQLVIPEYYPLF